jgi:hypothetical protein
VLGTRVRYRIYFDEVLADYDHAWEYAATGAPVPRLERDLLTAVVIGPGTPLQLRSGGVFRGMVAERDADAVRAAIEELGDDVTAAAGKLADVKAVQEVLARILGGGAAHVLGMTAADPSARVGFVADDGTANTVPAADRAKNACSSIDPAYRDETVTAAGRAAVSGGAPSGGAPSGGAPSGGAPSGSASAGSGPGCRACGPGGSGAWTCAGPSRRSTVAWFTPSRRAISASRTPSARHARACSHDASPVWRGQPSGRIRPAVPSRSDRWYSVDT